MWRCPRCVAHVKDELEVCPICQYALPDDPQRKIDRELAKLDREASERLPQEVQESEPLVRPLPLVPSLENRNLAKRPRLVNRRGFLIGFVGTILCFLAHLWTISLDLRDFIRRLPALVLAAGIGCLVGLATMLVWSVGESVWETLFAREDPDEERLAEQVEERSEILIDDHRTIPTYHDEEPLPPSDNIQSRP